MMRAHFRFASVFVLGAAFSVGCGGGSGGTGEDVDSGTEDSSIDTGGSEVEVDSAVDPDTGTFVIDSGADTSVAPETSAETSVDTGPGDTGTPDTGTPDTGPPDMGVDTTPACTVGAVCDDSNACTTGETFNAACVCTGGTAVVCMDTNACTVDTCVPATGCKFTTAADGTTCGAGKKCNAGVCADLCTSGAGCDDANNCTTGEKFTDTCACSGGTAVVCDDSNVCTADSCNPTTGCVATPLAEGATCGAGKVCKAGGCVDPTASLPTITILTPTAGQKASFTTASMCQGMSTSVAYTAPNGFGQMRWRFVVPSSTNVGGLKTCNGLPAYGYFMDATTYDGRTAGTFTENVSLAGNYTASDRWWWCTAPGTSGMSVVSLAPTTSTPPGPPGPSYSTLSNYCYYKGVPPDAATTAQWTLEVELRDKLGNVVTASRKFWVYTPS